MYCLIRQLSTYVISFQKYDPLVLPPSSFLCKDRHRDGTKVQDRTDTRSTHSNPSSEETPVRTTDILFFTTITTEGSSDI